MTCDFCEEKHFNFENTFVQFEANNILLTWCGICRGGSSVYFIDMQNNDLISLIEICTEVLKTDPITIDEPDEIHQRKWQLFEEMEKAKQELIFRVADV